MFEAWRGHLLPRQGDQQVVSTVPYLPSFCPSLPPAPRTLRHLASTLLVLHVITDLLDVVTKSQNRVDASLCDIKTKVSLAQREVDYQRRLLLVPQGKMPGYVGRWASSLGSVCLGWGDWAVRVGWERTRLHKAGASGWVGWLKAAGRQSAPSHVPTVPPCVPLLSPSAPQHQGRQHDRLQAVQLALRLRQPRRLQPAQHLHPALQDQHRGHCHQLGLRRSHRLIGCIGYKRHLLTRVTSDICSGPNRSQRSALRWCPGWALMQSVARNPKQGKVMHLLAR